MELGDHDAGRLEPAEGGWRLAGTAVYRLGDASCDSTTSSHAKTSQDFIKWMNTQQGPPPVRPWVGTTDLPAGGAMLLDVYFEPGAYSTVCRVRVAGNGRPHDEHGHAEFRVR